MFFVRSEEQNPCPICTGVLKGFNRRGRGYINELGEKKILSIRRLRCACCKKIHHELPDLLVPYKRYGSKSIEEVISGSKELSVAADESTITRWKQWFLAISAHLAGALLSIAIRYGIQPVEESPDLPQSSLQRVWHYVGDAPLWLARIVRSVVNANCWIHTRSAFMSG